MKISPSWHDHDAILIPITKAVSRDYHMYRDHHETIVHIR